MRAAALLLVACSAPTVTPSNRAAVPPGHVAIEDAPRLAADRQPLPAGAERDCRLGVLLRTRFRGQSVRACGSLPLGVSPDVQRDAHACMTRALDIDEPFLVEQEGRDHDISAVVGMREGDRLAVYKFYYLYAYDGASDKEGAHVERCAVHASFDNKAVDCRANLLACIHCSDSREVEHCSFVHHGIHPPG